MNDAMRAQTISIPAADGAAIEAYYAVPERGEPHGSVVVIHHAPGYDEATKEIARRFAARGFAALCPNLYSREAPGLEPRAAAAQVRAAGGVPDDQVTGDVAAAADYLRAQPDGNGKVGVIGYCTGGRLAADRLTAMVGGHLASAGLGAGAGVTVPFVPRSRQPRYSTQASAITTAMTSGWPTINVSQLGSFAVVVAGVNSTPMAIITGSPAATMRSWFHLTRPSTSSPPEKMRPNRTVVAPDSTGGGIATSSASK
jgi:dienelactone hydrolase